MEIKERIYRILLLVFFCILGSCSRSTSEKTTVEEPVHNQNEVILTTAQLESASIRTGKIGKALLASEVECTGSIEADPNNRAAVSPPMKGFVREIRVHPGDYVRKGEILAYLQHPGYIRLQQEYLEILSDYEYYQQDFKRQGELSLDQAASLKTMQQAQNEFRKTEAGYYALRQQLLLLGINPDSLVVENITSVIALRTPISGYLTRIDASIGMLCSEEQQVFQVVGEKNAYLHLRVSASNATRIAPGQTISFTPITESGSSFHAVVETVNLTVDEENMLSVHAPISDDHHSLIPGAYVKAGIFVNSDSVYALPSSAIVQGNHTRYVFIKKDSIRFEAMEVETGGTMNDRIEIVTVYPDLLNAEIVIEGADYLHAEMLNEK